MLISALTIQFSLLTIKAKKLLSYWPLIGFITSIVLSLSYTPYFIIDVALFGYFLFKGTLNTVQGIGPVYWISRDYTKPQGFFVWSGFMRETDSPWRMGRGIQITVYKRSFQIGLCKKMQYNDEQEAQLGVLGARFMDTKPKEIGNW